jgi:tetratricopeptide (TPR) repeat protein
MQSNDYLLETAFKHHQQGDIDAARAGYEQVLAMNPKNTDALHLLGCIQYRDKDYERAIALMEKACDLQPRVAAFHKDLGDVHFERGDCKQAIKRYRKALKLEPQYAEAHNNLGNVFLQSKKFKEALLHYEKALQSKADFADPWYNCGRLYQAQNNHAAAKECFSNAIQINRQFADAYHALGIVCYEQQSFQEACELFNIAVKLDNHNSTYRYHLALSLRDAGIYALAFEQLLWVVKHEPDNLLAKIEFAKCLKFITLKNYKQDLEAVLLDCYQTNRLSHQCLANLSCQLLTLKYHGEFSAEGVKADPVLLEFLSKTVNTDPIMELQLTRWRQALLEKFLKKEAFDKSELNFAAALAKQCFNNEYVFSASADDDASILTILETLNDNAVATLSGDEWVTTLVIIALYQPLRKLAFFESLSRQDLSTYGPAVQLLLKTTTIELLEEATYGKTIQSLSAITESNSCDVQAQYEENPYPRWHSLNQPQPEALNKSGEHRILIAGCGTGKHAIRTAMRYPESQLTAIDLSRASLSYAMRMATQFNIRNIEFYQADILNLSALPRQFDIIECMGVLHHMKTPLEGWAQLVNQLKDDGVLKIGLYSELARQHYAIVQHQSTPDDTAQLEPVIRERRQSILSDANHEQAPLMAVEDFYSMSGARDLLFNVMEHRYTIPMIQEQLAQLQLQFLGFCQLPQAVFTAYQEQFGADADLCDLSQWAQFEASHPETFIEMYKFYCQKA